MAGPDHRDAPRQARHPGRQHRAHQHGRRPRSRPSTGSARRARASSIAMSAIDQGRFTVAGGRRRARPGLPRRIAPVRPRAADVRRGDRAPPAREADAREDGGRASRPAGCSCGAPAFLKNHGVRNTRETSLAKWFATDHAVASALDAIQVHGANGYSNEFPVERYLRNSKAAVIYEGTSQLHTLIQADYALGYREDRPLRCEPLPGPGLRAPAGVRGRRRRPRLASRRPPASARQRRPRTPAELRRSSRSPRPSSRRPMPRASRAIAADALVRAADPAQLRQLRLVLRILE